MPKTRNIYTCTECAYETGKWLGKCPMCNNFNTFEESVIDTKKEARKFVASSSKVFGVNEISTMPDFKTPTKIGELDRVLSGGIVAGSLILIGGDPGIGKSTLILQICQTLGEQNKKILYVSGEESINQIKLRADRLNVTTENLFLLAETDLDIIQNTVSDISPDILIIDSIQTVYSSELPSVPGSVTQIRECTSRFMGISKTKGISTIVIGHVTKEGTLAGPRVLEHMVDTVLYFEGEKQANYRLIRAVKNRFGATNEIGVFEMAEAGLLEITNPSEYMLSGRPVNVSGSVVTCTMEGSRPILAEVQALVTYSNFGMPRRTATGMDYNRVTMLMAVLEKRVGLQLGSSDSYVNIAGGMKLIEPAIDAAVTVAVASSFKNKLVDPYSIAFGEVGLTGEIRAVSQAEKRVLEACKLGFKTCILPRANLKGMKKIDGVEIIGVSNVSELLDVALQ